MPKHSRKAHGAAVPKSRARRGNHAGPRTWAIRIGVLLAIATAAGIAVLRPGIAVDPARAVATAIVQALGAGLITVALLTAVVSGVAWRRPGLLFAHWRQAMAIAAFAVALQGGLSYYEAALPLAGLTWLGGDVGLAIQGEARPLGYVRVGAAALAGLWLLVPVSLPALLRVGVLAAAMAFRGVETAARGFAAAAVGVAHGAAAAGRAYQRAPVHKGVGRLALGAWRAFAPVRALPERHREAGDAKLADRVGAYFSGRAPEHAGRPHALDPVVLSLPVQAPQQQAVGAAAIAAVPPPAGPGPMPAGAAAQAATAQASPPFVLAGAAGAIAPAPPSGVAAPPRVVMVEQQQETEARGTARGLLNMRVLAREWKLPPLNLLRPPEAPVSASKEHNTTARLIEETLGEHGVEVRVAEIRPGPAVTMFGLVPGWNRKMKSGQDDPDLRLRVKVDSILAREKDLALALAAPSLRLEAPVPGESVVGVEVPNRRSNIVTLRTVMASDAYKHILEKDGLPVALGVATAGEPVSIDLQAMPHLLIAGATGSGKSVCMNSIICSLIKDQQPSRVRLLLVDPKRVELTPYNGIPHLVTPVVVDADRVVRLLRGAIQEMLRRYRLLEDAGARNIQSYNRSPRSTERMPYLVICIDELADLMMTSSFEVEQSICRLAQLGRATGIHLVVATQRPSVDVVTGLIKANFPSRISFSVASQVDSRTILDSVGAERLLGKGDMLFLGADSPKPRRLQGVYVSEEETEALANYWRSQHGPGLVEIPLEALAREAELAAAPPPDDADAEDIDDSEEAIYERAMQLALTNRQVSTSLLQRRLRIGYPRAARLMEKLEADGVVGGVSEAGKPREVILRSGDDAARPS